MAGEPMQKNTIYKIRKNFNFWGVLLPLLMVLSKKNQFLIMPLNTRVKLKKYLENKL